MEPYPRTTRPVGAEAAAGGAPATTQAAQRLGSGVTDGPNFGHRITTVDFCATVDFWKVEKTRRLLESTVDFCKIPR